MKIVRMLMMSGLIASMGVTISARGDLESRLYAATTESERETIMREELAKANKLPLRRRMARYKEIRTTYSRVKGSSARTNQ